jgi:Antitoxin of toxin-antitoxin stability system
MSTVAIAEAAQRLDELVTDSLAGKEVVLTREDQPVAKIVPLPFLQKATHQQTKNDQMLPRIPGSAKDLPHFMADDFDDTPEGFEEYMP